MSFGTSFFCVAFPSLKESDLKLTDPQGCIEQWLVQPVSLNFLP